MEWKADYSVGVAELDRQHRKLFELINRLHEAMKGGRGAQVVDSVLTELVAYTRGHFAREEQLMQTSQYPGYAAQKREHEELTRKVEGFVGEKRSNGTANTVELAQFLKEWLTHHILGVDRAYKEHFAAQGVK